MLAGAITKNYVGIFTIKFLVAYSIYDKITIGG